MILRWILLLLVLANKLALASSFLSDDLDENEFLWSLDRKLFPIDNQNESMCSPLQGRLSLFYRLTHILDPSFPLGRSPSEAKSTLWAGGFQRTGDEVLGHSLGCPSLPIRRDHNYTYYTVGGGLIRRAERTLIPRLNQYSFFNHTGIRFISALACGVSNCDTVGVSLYPVIIPFSMAPYLYIAGIAFSKNGNLVSNSSAIKVWDGSGLAKFTPRGHFWFSVLWYILPPLPTPLRYAFGITLVFSIFGGRDPYATTAFATVESANIQFLYFIQAISLGSGTGGVRYHTGNRQVDLCSPAGVFARVSPKIQSPAFEKVVEGYFGQNWFIGESSVDMAVHFDASEKGFQSVQLRFLADLVVLNRELFKVVVQMQYLSPRELKRRRKSRIEKYGCSCPMGFDAAGVCKEPINPVDKWAQDRNLNEHMLTFSGEFNASFFWDLVGIKDVYFTFALPIQKGKAQKPFMSLSGVLNVLFIKGLGGAIDIEHPRANFTVVTRLAGLFDVEVSGFSNTTALQGLSSFEMQNNRNPDLVMGTDGSISDLKWELIVKVHWGRAIRPLIQKMHGKYVRTVAKIKKALRNVKTRLHQLGYQKDNSTNATLSQSLNKRGPFLDNTEVWYNQDEESGHIVHLLRKWNHAPMPETQDILQLNIISSKDSKQSVAIPLQHYQLTLEGYRRMDTLFYRTVDLRNETDIVTNLEGLSNEIAKALDNSLFSGIRSVNP